jgi:PIN domain nuclease of toxin-antitoxin system
VTRVLLDTHAYLWFVFDDRRLSRRADSVISDPETEILLSVGSLWEIAIKAQLGRLDLGMPIDTFFSRYVEQRQVVVVGIQISHLVAYGRLPLVHRDPFDRLLVAQAQTLAVPILSADPRLEPYGVPVWW